MNERYYEKRIRFLVLVFGVIIVIQAQGCQPGGEIFVSKWLKKALVVAKKKKQVYGSRWWKNIDEK